MIRGVGDSLVCRAAVAAALLVALSGSVAAGPEAGWWLDRGVQRELGLSTAQVAALDREFRRDLPARQARHRRLERLEAEFRTSLTDARLDETSAVSLIERIEQLRKERNVARALMLIRMYRLLNPSQRTQFRRLYGSWAAGAAPRR
jgi:Spy/CpxP family protein refolding chaperone